MIEEIKKHPVISGLLLVAAVVGSLLTLENGYKRVIEVLWPPEVLEFVGEICNVSDHSCSEGNRAFADFMTGKYLKTITLDLVVHNVSIGQFAERCEDEQILFNQQFSEGYIFVHYPTTEQCIGDDVFLTGRVGSFEELDAGLGFSTSRLTGEFDVRSEDAVVGPLGATRLD